MRKRRTLSALLSLIMVLSYATTVLAAPGESSSSVSWSGATTITTATTQSNQTYASTTADQNSLLIDTSEAVVINEPTVTKSGGTSASDNYSFYGINSGIMCKGGGTTTIAGGTVSTTAAGANGIFSYGANNGTTNAVGDGTTVTISDVTIETTGNGSGGIMTTYGGTTNASNLTITTSGGSSAPIRTDRGGGWVTVDGGSYTSNGVGSPAIYSTADVSVSNATLVSNASEGVCIEGTGSITLTDCDLTATNSSLNGNATFYDTIMIYQSQSGDASDGTSAFTMTGGTLTSNNGHVFHVTNTEAVITLSGVTIVNNDSDGVLLSVCDDGWSGASNVATLTVDNQTLEGNLLVGDDSTLTLNLTDNSSFTGTVSGEISNGSGTSVSSTVGTVDVTLDSTSTWNLTSDTYISSFSGTAANVINNGYTLYVNGTALSGTSDSSSSGTSTVTADQSAILTFSDDAITETEAGSGYSIDGTTLTITANGTYRIGGSCSEGSIVVSKELSDVTLVLDSLTLTSSSTAPIVVKKAATVNIHLDGTSTLTDNENPDNETSSDATVADAFEGAAIKVKSGSSVTFCGDGNLNAIANAKNGIKGGSTAALIFNQSGAVTVSGSGSYYAATTSGAAVNNGIACDGSIVFNQGTYSIKAAGDGIKSAPDATDETEGTTIDTDSAGTITINGGTFDIDVDGDGIQADTALAVNGGSFDIQTWKGYSVWDDTLADAYSCKGLKASGDRAEEAGYEPTLTITGGTFVLNTGDDAVHSDAYVTVTGGTFTIDTGDDGMHADTTLLLGTDSGNERDPDVTINNSYEGLEGGTVYIYSGRYYIIASDDGVNAAGGSSNGTDPGNGGDNNFNPGGNMGNRTLSVGNTTAAGGPGGESGGGPGGESGGGPGGESGGDQTSTSDYNIYVYGGDLYVNCSGDGLDSNGGLYLYGGQQAVFSQTTGGDNSAIDADGTILIDGATVFTAGTTGADGTASSSWFGSNQVYSASTSSYSANTVVNTKAGSSGAVILSYKLPKAANYIMASWPTTISSNTPSFATASSITSCKGGSWSHNWNSGVITTAATSSNTGLLKYTCTTCSETEYQTIPSVVTVAACDHSVEISTEETEDEGFTVTFDGDSGVSSIIAYETQDYTGTSETLSANDTTVTRDGSTGTPDSTGSGQVNFTIVLADGYTISSVTATDGTYKNIKGPSDTGLANTYRITKITSDTTVTITTVECEHGTVEDGTTPTWSWSSDYSTATLSYTCADCGNTVNVSGNVTSVLDEDGETINFTATATINGTEYTDTASATAFVATFATDGHATVNVYYTQDYTSVDKENAATAVARDSDSGNPIINGSGQINFTVVPDEGYALSSVSVTSGTYKNIKGPSDTGLTDTYRITKVSASTTITITTVECAHENVSNPVWNWSSDYSTATLSLDCADCGQTFETAGTVTSVLDEDGETINFTATATVNGTEYTDTASATAFVATFATDSHATVNVYYTQDYTSVDEENAATAVARDSDSGNPVITGDGQINFAIVVEDGYELDGAPVITGTYKNLKDISTDSGLDNAYRVTKVKSDLTITVNTVESESTVVLDYDAYNAALDEANALIETGLAQYEEDSASEFTAEIAAAQEDCAAAQTQEDVDAATARIVTAIENLKKGYIEPDYKGSCNIIGLNGVTILNNGESEYEAQYDEKIYLLSPADSQLAYTNADGTEIYAYLVSNIIYAPMNNTIYIMAVSTVAEGKAYIAGTSFENNKAKYNCQYSVPDDATFVETGIVMSFDKSTTLEIGADGARTFKALNIGAQNEYSITFNISSTNLGKTIYGKSYVTYIDGNGDTKTVYSDQHNIQLTEE